MSIAPNSSENLNWAWILIKYFISKKKSQFKMLKSTGELINNGRHHTLLKNELNNKENSVFFTCLEAHAGIVNHCFVFGSYNTNVIRPSPFACF